jgi:SAM-dependent methyltransferase
MARELQQSWSAAGYDRNARFVSDLGEEILGWLAPKPDERILDLGCGDGALTQRIVEAGASVVGVDASAELLRAARERGLDAREMDGHALTFSREFDAVFSNAALHWMTKPEKVLRGVAAALKPGGRFVAEFGGHGNVAAIVTALRSAAQASGGDAALAHPWFFPTAAEYEALLTEAGFACRRIELIPRPTRLPTGIEGWLLTFRKPFFDQFPQPEREAALQHAIDLLRPSLCDITGAWTADYVRLRVAATLVHK